MELARSIARVSPRRRGLKVRHILAWGEAPGCQPQKPRGLKARAKIPRPAPHLATLIA
jgi:hypothetical protein